MHQQGENGRKRDGCGRDAAHPPGDAPRAPEGEREHRRADKDMNRTINKLMETLS